ncbi:hypothetical protein FOZ61_006229 [Perkinsus olseni]|uniref:Uncharacterized protein n=1 Tax=Perkinsus olseni TaxID=32597 RepID=A0A7J6LE43_PEROL|nr:hypothetical protein FOZ61_006229 [Perkinsus olseni]
MYITIEPNPIMISIETDQLSQQHQSPSSSRVVVVVYRKDGKTTAQQTPNDSAGRSGMLNSSGRQELHPLPRREPAENWYEPLPPEQQVYT